MSSAVSVSTCRPAGVALCLIGLLATGVFLVLSPVAALAQQGWDPGIEGGSFNRRLSIGAEVGHPLVAGMTLGYHFDDRYAAQVGFSALSDFTAFSGEARLNLLKLKVARPVPFISGGFSQYYLRAGDEKSSPIGFQAGLGIDYTFFNYFTWGARLGYLKTFGGSGDSSIERYGISKDTERATFSMSARYLF